MNDQSFARAFIIMIAGFVVLGIVLFIIAAIMAGPVDAKLDAERQMDIDKVTAERVKPVGTLSVGEVAAVTSQSETTVAEEISGESTYQKSCFACHGTGAGGAPKLGDGAIWVDRIAKGVDVLYANAINGIQGAAGVMPAKGGNAALSDDAVKAAVDYMVEASQ